mgnify:CR=1 FL=1
MTLLRIGLSHTSVRMNFKKRNMLNRTRRLRKSEGIRRLVRENQLTVDDLIYPLFVEEGENIERSLKKFKRKFERTGVVKELRARQAFAKPSIIKRSSEDQLLVDQKTEALKLYEFYACPFCIKTRRAIKRLNLKVETRDAQTAGQFRKELEISGGKIQVPCLKLEGAGEATWIYESSDIIKYLDERF